MKSLALVLALFAALAVASNPAQVGNTFYSYGVCQPSGTYTMNECCPVGYQVITDINECQTAFSNMSPLEPGSLWGGDAPRTQRPYGCFQYLGNNYVHFNPTFPTQTLVGDDLVICKSTAVPTCAAGSTHRGTAHPEDTINVGPPVNGIELGAAFEVELEFNAVNPADGNYKPMFSRTIGSTFDNKFAQIDIQVQSNGNLNVFMGNGVTYGLSLNGGIVSANTRYHVRFAMDSSNVGHLYLNGLRKDQSTFSGSRLLNGVGNALQIGHYANSQQQYFNGQIRNVRVAAQGGSAYACAMSGTQDPVVSAFCDSVSASCTELAAHCTTLHTLNAPLSAAADDCDAAAAACQQVHTDCELKVQSCPLL